jgi:hypothetical protein
MIKSGRYGKMRAVIPLDSAEACPQIGRLGVAVSRRPLGKRPAVVHQLEQGKLACLFGSPSFHSLATQFAWMLPTSLAVSNRG